jgi:NAD(P)-dependent dehydrogenase (short-subunit alcohol dehydrogenase family)
VGDLDGKAALVTGGTSGIGFAICEAFLREGAGVVLTGRNEELGRTAERSLGAGASFLVADARSPTGSARACATRRRSWAASTSS